MDLPSNGVYMSGTESAKHALVAFANEHDARSAERRKPVRTVLIAAGAAIVVSRLLWGGAKRARGGRMMGLLLVARMAARYGPAALLAIKQAKRAYDENTSRRPSPVVRVPTRYIESAGAERR
jgi:hypothetical protein